MLKKIIISNKIGLILGFVIVCLFSLLAYKIFSLQGGSGYSRYLSAENLLMILAAITGGMVSGFVVEHYIIKKSTNMGQTWGAISGSILIFPLSFYGGSFFAVLTMHICFMVGGKIFVNYLPLFVISIPMFIVNVLGIIIFEYLGAKIGFALGSLIKSLVQRTS